MRAVLLHWHVGCVLGTVQPTSPAWQCSETPQHLAQGKGLFLLEEEADVTEGGQRWGTVPKEEECHRGGSGVGSVLLWFCCRGGAHRATQGGQLVPRSRVPSDSAEELCWLP